MKINEPEWDVLHWNVSDEEWNKPGPIIRSVELYSHPSSLEDQSLDTEDLEKKGINRLRTEADEISDTG